MSFKNFWDKTVNVLEIGVELLTFAIVAIVTGIIKTLRFLVQFAKKHPGITRTVIGVIVFIIVLKRLLSLGKVYPFGRDNAAEFVRSSPESRQNIRRQNFWYNVEFYSEMMVLCLDALFIFHILPER